MKRNSLLLLATCLSLPAAFAADAGLQQAVDRKIATEYASLEKIYRHLHANPELSFVEVETAALIARELRALGFEVTEKVGRHGVVAVMRNGPGPTVLVRADMDALPVKEATGVPYASTKVMADMTGKEQPAMHACAHDAHVTSLIGTARVMSAMKGDWSGTLVMIGQPAEEIGAGALAMLGDGLYQRFPKPDYVLALHVGGDSPAGEVAYVEGPAYANVDSIDILVRGIGGHGARPHSTRDPIVLAAQLVTALQTIVSRELKPGTPAVVTIGSLHAGTKRNIIPAEAKLELTLRSYDENVANHLFASIKRIAENLGRAAGLPDDLLPVVSRAESQTPLTYNDPALTRRLAGVFRQWFPAESVKAAEAATYGEDFSRYGRTNPKIPICIFWVGGSDPKMIAEWEARGQPWPSNHSPLWAPVPEPTLKAGVKSMSAALFDLMPKGK